MNIKNLLQLVLLLTAVMLLPANGTAQTAETRVFLLYDNIGEPYFTNNVDEAGSAVAAQKAGNETRVLVFHKRDKGGNLIYELVKDASARKGFRKQTLKTYASGANDSFSPDTLAAVVGDMRAFAPATRYGFAFGSHGMGWIPKAITIDPKSPGGKNPAVQLLPEEQKTAAQPGGRARYFTSDEDERLDIAEFASAIGAWNWDFILFDDCYLGSVEALYEMRALANHFIVSSAEILLDGFRYEQVIKRIFADWNDLAGIAKDFVDYYRESTDPDATVSVVKTAELDALAACVKAIFRSPGWKSVNPGLNPIQFFDGLGSHIFFDLDDYIRHGISPDSAEYKAFAAQLQKTVVFKDATETFTSDFGKVGKRYPISNHSGLTSFIPWSGTEVLMPYYKQTAWYAAVYKEQ